MFGQALATASEARMLRFQQCVRSRSKLTPLTGSCSQRNRTQVGSDGAWLQEAGEAHASCEQSRFCQCPLAALAVAFRACSPQTDIRIMLSLNFGHLTVDVALPATRSYRRPRTRTRSSANLTLSRREK
jgi:hypothetical protein